MNECERIWVHKVSFWKRKPENKSAWLVNWLPLAVAITAMSGLVYLAVQQNYRQSANDPQIQMAEDAAAALGGGQSTEAVIPTTKVDLNRSLATFMIVFDQNGQPVASSAVLDGKTPTPPAGVFDTARTRGENRFTWQPRDEVREAAIVRPIGGNNTGFILVGRSLGEVERREESLIKTVGLVWLAAMAVTLIKAIWLPKFLGS